MRYKIPVGYLPVVALIAVQTLGALTAGYAWFVAVIAVETLAALMPPRRPALASAVGHMLGWFVSELPFAAIAWLLAATLVAAAQGRLGSPGGLAALGLAVLTAGALAVIARRALMAGPAVAHALDRELGTGSRPATARLASGRLPGWRALARIVFVPLPLWPRHVQRIANIRYGDARRGNRLDLYRHRSRPAGAPVLIHFHGGGFRIGAKSRDALPLLHRLASQGWVCISASYRLGRAGQFPHSLTDAKKVIAWVRQHGAAYGADPSVLIVAGSSAGAHLAAMAALTPGDPAFQPGFEHVDTSVSAAVCLYGYYGDRETAGLRPSSPRAYARADAPAFLVAHGASDPLLPASSAASFVDALRRVSASPVVYAQLPAAQHSFDLFHSIRFEQVIDGIQAFTAWVLSARDHPGAASRVTPAMVRPCGSGRPGPGDQPLLPGSGTSRLPGARWRPLAGSRPGHQIPTSRRPGPPPHRPHRHLPSARRNGRTTAMMTTNSVQHSYVDRARTLRARGLAVAGAAAATTAVWALASPFAGLDVRLDPGHAAQHVGPVTAAVITVVAGLAGWALLTAFERLAARPPRRSWTITAVVVLVVSLAGPLGAGTTTSTKVALACMHLAAAAVLIPALARTAQAHKRPDE